LAHAIAAQTHRDTKAMARAKSTRAEPLKTGQKGLNWAELKY